MLTTQYIFSTLKEIPHDAKIISHQLMLRSGMIKKISSGLYTWLPTGVRVLNKVKEIIKTEMQNINALEVCMPIIQPESFWKKSGRLNVYGEELLTFFDRHNNKFILSPTNEELVTHFINSEINSYKKFPLIIFQIQNKFRDEIRPRFGIIRTREFIMKDAYSFHTNEACLNRIYKIFYNSYVNIFNKIQLKFISVEADSGLMGGHTSHEFQALSKNGEDEVVFSEDMSYSSNMNMAQSIEAVNFLKNKNIHKSKLDQIKSIKSLKEYRELNAPITTQIKTILVHTKINEIISTAALLIRGDHELNVFKVEKIDIIKKPLSFLNEQEILSLMGVQKKFLGPLGLKIPIIADISVHNMKNFTIGANINNYFFNNVNWNVDLLLPTIQDIRKITKNDLSPDKKNLLKIKKSIEIGHIFQLGTKYSTKMKKFFKDKDGKQKNLHMGCYGIGLTRVIAAVIEQNNDKNGIIWPNSIAPFEVVILPINMHKNIKIKELSYNLYKEIKKNGIDVILDNRNERPGIMFNEMDLIGIPHQIIISPRCINDNNIEYCERRNKKISLIPINQIINFIVKTINK